MSEISCRLYIGTSGYSYAEWSSAGFYPPGTKSGNMLPLYAGQFCATELNFTWYQMPKPKFLERMRRHVPETFRFAVKLTRTLTHEVDLNHWRGEARSFREGIAPLQQSGQLSAVLIQLPPSFRRMPDNRRYLGLLLDELRGLPLALEFRHASWAADRVFVELEKRRIALVCVDEPDLPGLMPALGVVTNPDLFYVRFHGRNAGGWRSGNMQKQFDYDYAEAELREWTQARILPMARQAAAGLIFFNNHVRAQAPRNAMTMRDILAEHGLMEAPETRAASSA